MNQPILTILLVASLSACAPLVQVAGIKPHDDQLEDPVEELPRDYFALQSRCETAWAALIDDWHAHGGGIADSLGETRRKIAEDQQSRLAKIVKRAWASQRDEYAMEKGVFGQWPLGKWRYRSVIESIRFTPEDGIPSDCETAAWLQDLLWSEVAAEAGGRLDVRRLAEVPVSMEWTSPSAQHWMTYWLFVRVE